MFCTNCGTKIPDGSRFCTGCGKALAANPAVAQPVYQAPAAEQPAPQPPVAEQPAYQPPAAEQPAYQPYQPSNPAYSQPLQAVPTGTSNVNVLVWGILAIAFSCTFYFSFLGIIFGAIALSKAKQYVAEAGILAGKAKVGRILGLVGLILGIVLTAILVLVIFIAILAVSSTSHYYY